MSCPRREKSGEPSSILLLSLMVKDLRPGHLSKSSGLTLPI